MLKKILLGLLAILLLCSIGAYFYLNTVNNFQEDGEVSLSILEEPVTLKRDANGIPYLYAQSFEDLIRAQGYVMAKDRIFQVELYRALIKGEMATYLGENLIASDTKMKVLGLYDNAVRHAKLLDTDSRNYLSLYAEGYNVYLETKQDEFPVELGLLGLKPSPMKVEDMLSVQHYVGFTHSQNYEDEILTLNLAATLGKEKAMELFPLNINPDREIPVQEIWKTGQQEVGQMIGQIESENPELAIPVSLPKMGSNNWVVAGNKSTEGKPILCNDPHLDARILPGPWYPIGLFTPEIQAVGAAIPGLPGILVGRNQNVAFGVTNAYGDSQDLYLETLDLNDSNLYVNGDTSLPFEVKTVDLKIKDGEAEAGFRTEKLNIRYTQRGPIISDHEAFDLDGTQPVSFRWTLAEVNSGHIGFNRILKVKNIAEMDSLIRDIDIVYLNFVFADVHGGIGHRASGLIPIRARHQGAIAKKAGAEDDWLGYLPKGQMPGQINPAKSWVATANHDVVPDSFPYYYSSHFSPNYRYLRIKKLLEEKQQRNAEEYWQLILDVGNEHARLMTPIFIEALENAEDLTEINTYLKNWDFEDNIQSVGASIFHLMHEELVRLMLKDDLSSEKLLEKYLSKRYYWLQRLDDIILNQPESQWFDIQDTPEKEVLKDLIVMAAKETETRLTTLMGANKEAWTWGALHSVTFTSPLRPSGVGRDWLGGGNHPAAGSGETINRGQYVMDHGPYESQWFSSMRMVADLSDSEKIRAVVSGGNAARQFHPYFSAQLPAWLEGKSINWWLDWQKVEENAKHSLELKPE
jgi:penicillin amidase